MAATNSSDSGTGIPQETLNLLPIISQTLIRQYCVNWVSPGSLPTLEFVDELQVKISQFQVGEQQKEGKSIIHCLYVFLITKL